MQQADCIVFVKRILFTDVGGQNMDIGGFITPLLLSFDLMCEQATEKSLLFNTIQ